MGFAKLLNCLTLFVSKAGIKIHRHGGPLQGFHFRNRHSKLRQLRLSSQAPFCRWRMSRFRARFGNHGSVATASPCRPSREGERIHAMAEVDRQHKADCPSMHQSS